MDIEDLTYKINGCAMKVHNVLGNGFQEVIYQRCLAMALRKAGIKFRREVEQEIFYDGVVVGKRRADFVIEDILTVELKACFNLEAAHLVQAKNYVVAYNFNIGLLINFGLQVYNLKRFTIRK